MSGYSLFDYGGMVGPQNQRREEAFTRALREAVTENSVVLDIGTGPGYFALLAAKFGARKVYAIESNSLVRIGPRLAADNGFSDRITFFEGDSTEIELPEKADVIIADLGGSLPLANRNIVSLIDARERHLAPGGRFIPGKTSISAAVVTTPKFYNAITGAWAPGRHGLDWTRVRSLAVNAHRKCQLKAENLLTDSKSWVELNYLDLKAESASVRAEFSLEAMSDGTAHGIALWTDYRLAPGIELFSSPTEPPLPIYGQSLLPWTQPVELAAGDRVKLRIQVIHRNRGNLWSWRSAIVDGSNGDTKATFNQATLPPLAPDLANEADD